MAFIPHAIATIDVDHTPNANRQIAGAPRRSAALKLLNKPCTNRGIIARCDAIDSRRELAVRVSFISWSLIDVARDRGAVTHPSMAPRSTAFPPPAGSPRQGLVKMQPFRASCVLRPTGMRQFNRSSTNLPKNKRKKSRAWERPAAHAWAGCCARPAEGKCQWAKSQREVAL